MSDDTSSSGSSGHPPRSFLPLLLLGLSLICSGFSSCSCLFPQLRIVIVSFVSHAVWMHLADVAHLQERASPTPLALARLDLDLGLGLALGLGLVLGLAQALDQVLDLALDLFLVLALLLALALVCFRALFVSYLQLSLAPLLPGRPRLTGLVLALVLAPALAPVPVCFQSHFQCNSAR